MRESSRRWCLLRKASHVLLKSVIEAILRSQSCKGSVQSSIRSQKWRFATANENPWPPTTVASENAATQPYQAKDRDSRKRLRPLGRLSCKPVAGSRETCRYPLRRTRSATGSSRTRWSLRAFCYCGWESKEISRSTLATQWPFNSIRSDSIRP